MEAEIGHDYKTVQREPEKGSYHIQRSRPIQRHAESGILGRKAYECLKLAPNTVGKLAVEEHYLKKKPWEEIALEQNYSREHVKKLAYECIRRVEDKLDKDDAK